VHALPLQILIDVNLLVSMTSAAAHQRRYGADLNAGA
jgi:hypothetical protein